MTSDHLSKNAAFRRYDFLCLVGDSIRDDVIGRILKFIYEAINSPLVENSKRNHQRGISERNLLQGISDRNTLQEISKRNPQQGISEGNSRHSVRFVNIGNLTSLQSIYKLIRTCDACIFLAKHNDFPEVLKDTVPFIMEITPSVLIKYTTTDAIMGINENSKFVENERDMFLNPSLMIENVIKTIDMNGKTENEDLQRNIEKLIHALKTEIRNQSKSAIQLPLITSTNETHRPTHTKKKRKTRNSLYKELLKTNLEESLSTDKMTSNNQPRRTMNNNMLWELPRTINNKELPAMNNEVLGALPGRYEMYKRRREDRRNIEHIFFASFETKFIINQLQIDALEYVLIHYYDAIMAVTS